jgi:chemotaxis protein MotB
MQAAKLSVLLFVCVAMFLTNGCVSERQYRDLKIANSTQQRRIDQLESELQATKLELEQAQRGLQASSNRGSIETDAMKQKIAALEEELAAKKALIARMQHQLVYGGAALPVELNAMLEDFAKGKEMITYDASKGMVKFKSDLLFAKGSDEVTPEAVAALQTLCQIMNSEQGKEFDLIVAGHTDDIPIAKAETKAKHPTNWHLSADRAVSVVLEMAKCGISPERMSARGFSEFRPVVPNEANKRGNPQNRRVEIYIVPKGV